MVMDHEARWASYARRAADLAESCDALPGASVALAQFTLDERLVDGPVNAVIVRGGGDLTGTLAARAVSVHALAEGDATVFCTETLTDAEVRDIGAAMSEVWPN